MYISSVGAVHTVRVQYLKKRSKDLGTQQVHGRVKFVFDGCCLWNTLPVFLSYYCMYSGCGAIKITRLFSCEGVGCQAQLLLLSLLWYSGSMYFSAALFRSWRLTLALGCGWFVVRMNFCCCCCCCRWCCFCFQTEDERHF